MGLAGGAECWEVSHLRWYLCWRLKNSPLHLRIDLLLPVCRLQRWSTSCLPTGPGMPPETWLEMYKWPLFEIRTHSDLRLRLASCQLGEQYHGPSYCNGAIQNFGDNVLCHLAVGAVVVGAGGPVIEAEAEAEADEPQSNDCQKLDSQEGPNNHVDKAPCHLGVGAVIVGPGSPVAGTEAEAETVVDGAVLVADEPELNEGGQVLGWQEGLNGCKDEVPCHLSVGPLTVGAGGTVVGTVAGVAGAFRAAD